MCYAVFFLAILLTLIQIKFSLCDEVISVQNFYCIYWYKMQFHQQMKSQNSLNDLGMKNLSAGGS